MFKFTHQRENLRQLQTRWQCDNTSLFPFKRWMLEVMKVWPPHRLNFLAGVLEWLRVLLAGRADPLVGAAAVAVGALRTNQRWALWSRDSSPPITAHLVAGAGAVGAHAEVAALPGLGRHVAVVQGQHLGLVTGTDSSGTSFVSLELRNAKIS